MNITAILIHRKFKRIIRKIREEGIREYRGGKKDFFFNSGTSDNNQTYIKLNFPEVQEFWGIGVKSQLPYAYIVTGSKLTEQ